MAKSRKAFRAEWQRFESVHRFETRKHCDISDNAAK